MGFTLGSFKPALLISFSQLLGNLNSVTNPAFDLERLGWGHLGGGGSENYDSHTAGHGTAATSVSLYNEDKEKNSRWISRGLNGHSENIWHRAALEMLGLLWESEIPSMFIFGLPNLYIGFFFTNYLKASFWSPCLLLLLSHTDLFDPIWTVVIPGFPVLHHSGVSKFIPLFFALLQFFDTPMGYPPLLGRLREIKYL